MSGPAVVQINANWPDLTPDQYDRLIEYGKTCVLAGAAAEGAPLRETIARLERELAEAKARELELERIAELEDEAERERLAQLACDAESACGNVELNFLQERIAELEGIVDAYRNTRDEHLQVIAKLRADLSEGAQLSHRLRNERDRLRAVILPGAPLLLIIDRLRAEVEALRADAQRLDSGTILLKYRGEWSDSVLFGGVDMRAAIDAAIAARKGEGSEG